MKKLIYIIVFLFFVSQFSFSQMITYSQPVKEDTRDINFEVIGKMKGDFLIFKNLKGNYAVSIYDNDMQLVNNVKLDFLPEKTFNVNFVAYPDFFYLIYQYQRKGIVHCMGVKLDAESKLLSDPIELDTTKLDWLDESKIYTTINSDDKQKIMVFKIQRKGEKLNFSTLLLDNQLKLIKQSRQSLEYEENRNTLSDFLLDNNGNLVFAKSYRRGNRENINDLSLVIKSSMADSFTVHKIDLSNHYIDDAKIKIDNSNGHYILNSLYFDERRGDIDGLFSNIWNAAPDTSLATNFTKFNNELRSSARTEGPSRDVFNDFFIRNIIVKKDGGYVLTAEDFSTRSNNLNNPWNRWDYLYGTPYTMTPYGYYYYNPSYWMYRPYSDLYNNQSTRFYYDNILLISVGNDASMQWGNVLQKEQYSTDDDNYLSYLTFNTSSGIHFLFNEMERKDMMLIDNSLTSQGITNREPPLKGIDDDYQFMPKFGKQVSARQVIIPCTYRNSISFAKIDY